MPPGRWEPVGNPVDSLQMASSNLVFDSSQYKEPIEPKKPFMVPMDIDGDGNVDHYFGIVKGNDGKGFKGVSTWKGGYETQVFFANGSSFSSFKGDNSINAIGFGASIGRALCDRRNAWESFKDWAAVGCCLPERQIVRSITVCLGRFDASDPDTDAMALIINGGLEAGGATLVYKWNPEYERKW